MFTALERATHGSWVGGAAIRKQPGTQHALPMTGHAARAAHERTCNNARWHCVQRRSLARRSPIAMAQTQACAGAGIGGGGVLVPLYILVLGFDTAHAVALSNLTIAGGAFANLWCNLERCDAHHCTPPTHARVSAMPITQSAEPAYAGASVPCRQVLSGDSIHKYTPVMHGAVVPAGDCLCSCRGLSCQMLHVCGHIVAQTSAWGAWNSSPPA